MVNSTQLHDAAWAKQNPEFAKEIQELDHFLGYAARMVQAGELTKQEAEDYEGLLYQKFMDALPVGEFNDMLKDGRLDQLQALCGHDGTRDVGDVEDARTAVDRKIKAHILDDAWISQKIDSQKYAEMAREHLGGSDDLDLKISSGDYDGAASEMFAMRHDREPDHGSDLEKWLSSNFGEKKTGPEGRVTRESSSSDEVERDAHGRDADGYIDINSLSPEGE